MDSPSEPSNSLEQETVTHRSPAASESLLQTILDGALDSGYRREAEKSRSVKIPLWRKLLLLVLLVGLVSLTTVAATNLRQAENNAEQVHEKLLDQVDTSQQKLSEFKATNAALNEEIRRYQSEADNVAHIAAPLLASGASTAVSGPGISVTVTDGAHHTAAMTVRDSDLRLIMNALWAGGAEAIAINDKRVGPMTSVRTAGKAVLVNLEAVSSPYVIEAVGDPEALAKQMGNTEMGEAVRALSSSVGFTIETRTSDNLKLPGVPVSTFYSVDAEAGEGIP